MQTLYLLVQLSMVTLVLGPLWSSAQRPAPPRTNKVLSGLRQTPLSEPQPLALCEVTKKQRVSQLYPAADGNGDESALL